ncbi:MAG: hypothetical protein RLO81_05055 [Fulvivirga sp.]|uniref:hypothetical protein n=1 Tax=Fulvivirga sp. TaxID=1931237 RepID=UPI0032EFBA45
MKLYRIVVALFIFITSACGEKDDPGPDEEAQLKQIEIELLSFEFIPDTGNNSTRLRYDVKFINPNKFGVIGFYSIKTIVDGLEVTRLSSDSSECSQIEAESECLFSFDAEDSWDIARTNSVEIVSIEYKIQTQISE